MKRLFFAVCLCLAATVSAAFAACPCKSKVMQHGSVDMKGPGCPRIDTVLMHRQDLKLSNDQAGRIKGLQAALIRDNAKNMAELRIAKMDLDDMLSSTAPDAAAIKTQMKKVSDLELQASGAKVDAYTKALGILNNDQKTKFNDIWNKLTAASPGE